MIIDNLVIEETLKNIYNRIRLTWLLFLAAANIIFTIEKTCTSFVMSIAKVFKTKSVEVKKV